MDGVEADPRITEAELSEAIHRAAQRVLADQSADGAWHYGNPMGPRTTALVLIAERYLDNLGEADAEAGLAWLISQQREDGSFVAYTRADRGGIAMTATCLAGMRSAGAGADHPAVEKARSYLKGAGGISSVDPGTRLLLGVSGEIPPAELDEQPLGIFASRLTLRLLEPRFSAGAIMFMMALSSVGADLRRRERGERAGWLARRAQGEIVEFLMALQSPNGSFFDLPLATSWFLLALRGAGLDADDPRMARALGFLESRKRREGDRLFVVAMDSEVWNSGLCLRALALAGVPEQSPSIRKGAEALMRMQIHAPPTPRLFQPKPDAPRDGGWAFTADNPLQADTDDTGVALAGLVQIARAGLGDDELTLSIGKGVEWLLAMQNRDGGWAAFAYGLPPKSPGPMDAELLMNPPKGTWARFRMFLRPPPEMGDPSTAGLTGRVLFALGRLGFDAGDPPIERAIAFLERQQVKETGAFWGMWMVNYLPATACVLMGLASVGADMDAPWVEAAIDFLLAHQNEDGGWGEEPESYLDPSLAGAGDSMPALTALVALGLIEAGHAESEAVARALRYLLDRQDADGGFTDTRWLQVVLFPDTLYFNEAHPICFPLEALSRYRDEVGGAPTLERDEAGAPRGPALWTDAFLDEMRLVQDAPADRVVAALFEDGGIEAVNALLATMTSVDAPLPEGLPEEARSFFESTTELPDDIDMVRVQEGEVLFGLHGFPMIAALFTASLPEAYAAANGANVLDATQRLERDIDNRILETAQFLIDVLATDGLSLSRGRGIRTAQKVRLIHAAVRHLIAKKGNWNAAFGEPINQEDLAGTLLTFSEIVLEAMRVMRIELDAEQQEAYLHVWRAVGSLIGIRPELIPRDVIEARILMKRIRRRQQRRSEVGIRLSESLLRSMRRHLPWWAPGGLPAVMVRALIGHRRADMLEVPRHPLLERSSERFLDAADRHGFFAGDPIGIDPSRPASRRRAGARARFHVALIEGMVWAERKGKKVRFRLPEELRRASHQGT